MAGTHYIWLFALLKLYCQIHDYLDKGDIEMKKLFHIAVILAFLLALLPAAAMAHTEDEPLVVDLLAGQTTDIGDVKVWNDADNLYVQFVSVVCMVETHLHVATDVNAIPQKNGNPIPGKFAYPQFHGCSFDYTYVIPLGDWVIGQGLYIAAHAALGNQETMAIFSDGLANTYVADGNVPLAIYPYLAVDTWEAFGDPPDPTVSYWEQQLTYSGSPFAFSSQADWIWEDYRVVDPKTTQNVTFEHTFTVPGYPMGGKLYIATDNTYSASLNGSFVGAQTNYNNWRFVGGYDIFPLEGNNVLQVLGSNYGDSSYNLDNNPAGLIYQAEIKYLTPGETAWGAGEPFPGKNWATYFMYTIQGVCPSIVDKSGNIEVLDYIPSDIRVGQFEDDDYVRVWKEFEGSLTTDLAYDLEEGRVAKTEGPAGSQMVIPADTDVCVYYVHLDNVGPSSTVQHTGYLEFATDISGLVISGGNLGTFANKNLMFAADDQIGYSGTTYPDASLYPPNVDYLRGFDVNYGSNLDDATFNGSRVDFTMWVVNAHDSFRVVLPQLP